jgi:diketogulonate reductase-like aldo/keto reductase
MIASRPLARRALLGALAGAACAPRHALAAAPLTRPIQKSGEAVPVIGLGTWITFNVGDDPVARDARAEVMRAFFEGGGRLIDSSPMYASSEAVIGHGLAKLGRPPGLLAATKVWTARGGAGPAQIEESRRLWGVPRFDLLQVHNLLAWEAHLETLLAMKAAEKVRYIGITTSHGRRHGEIEKVMRTQPIDFVQVTYNPVDREVEARILPLARERGIAVIANRPFRGGPLVRALTRRPLPGWAAAIDSSSWAEVLLKHIVAHPAITCVIPATTRVDHARENGAAAMGRLPEADLRRRIEAAAEDA